MIKKIITYTYSTLLFLFFRVVKAADHTPSASHQQNNFDFESRCFWPWSGTNEDPVTGGTHTFLAKYWSTRLNKQKMRSFQCSERSGFMEVEILDKKTMSIKSEAQIILKGELRIYVVGNKR